MSVLLRCQKVALAPNSIVDQATSRQKTSALYVGTEDYLTKPFAVSELLARVRATWRRQRQSGADNSGVVQFGDV